MHQIALVGCSISLFRRRKQAVSTTDQRRKQYKLGARATNVQFRSLSVYPLDRLMARRFRANRVGHTIGPGTCRCGYAARVSFSRRV